MNYILLQLHKKEGQFIRKWGTNKYGYNKNVAGRNHKEYNEEHKEQSVEYYEKHKEKYKEQFKKYYEEHKEQTAELINCPFCNTPIQKCSFLRHTSSKKHIENIQAIDLI